MRSKGLTLVELLVAMLISVILLGVVITTFVKIYTKFMSSSASGGIEVQRLLAVEIIRNDIEHIGYGLALRNQKGVLLNDKYIEWDPVLKKLTLRSVINTTKKDTWRWQLLKAYPGGKDYVSGDFIDDDEYVNLLDSYGYFAFFGKYADIDVNSTGYYVAFPTGFDGDSPQSDCIDIDNDPIPNYYKQFCNVISYAISATQSLGICNPNVGNLLRRVGANAINNSGGVPVIHCVADFDIRVDWDDDEDGVIEADEENIDLPSTATAEDIVNKLKKVNVYLLVQGSRYDVKFNFSNYTSCGTYKCVIVDDVELKLPDKFEHYRWKVLKLSVIPFISGLK